MLQDLCKFPLEIRVQAFCRLVEKQDVRTAEQDLRQREPLLFAPGKIVGVPVFQSLDAAGPVTGDASISFLSHTATPVRTSPWSTPKMTMLISYHGLIGSRFLRAAAHVAYGGQVIDLVPAGIGGAAA